MFSYKVIDFGFIVLCPERNLGGLKGTSRNISSFYSDRPRLCVTGGDATDKEIIEMKEFCPETYRGKNSITSLINIGLKESKAEWNFIVFAGTAIRPRFFHKYAYFIEDEKDILFPIVDRKTAFDECTLNGILIHKNAIKEIGEIDEENELDICRLIWSLEAIQKGYKFKAIMGARIT